MTFSDNFLKSFRRLTSIRTKLSVVSLLLKLSTGWRAKKRNAEIVCVTSSMVVKKFKVQGLYILCSTDIIKHLRYMQVLKVWDILPDLCAIQTLVNHLDLFFVRYTAGFIKLCCEKYFEGYVLPFSILIEVVHLFLFPFIWNYTTCIYIGTNLFYF